MSKEPGWYDRGYSVKNDKGWVYHSPHPRLTSAADMQSKDRKSGRVAVGFFSPTNTYSCPWRQGKTTKNAESSTVHYVTQLAISHNEDLVEADLAERKANSSLHNPVNTRMWLFLLSRDRDD